MDNLTITLNSPVVVAGETISSLTLRELTVAENLALDKSHGTKSTLEQDINFFAVSCGVAPDVILGLKQRDWTRLKARYWETLGNVEPEPGNSV